MELWHIHPGYWNDSFLLIAQEITPSPDPTMMESDGVAIIPVVGPTSKYGAWGTTSTVGLRKLVREAASNPAIERVMGYFDTPGGTVAGNLDLANDFRALADTKPTFAYGADLLASAGYQVASQAGRVFANQGALVGSIGTMATIADTSKMAEQLGVRVHSLATGAHKGAGMMGVPVTEEQVQAQRELVKQVNEQFIASVASGRNMADAQVRNLADGRLHTAATAVELGLIDHVAPFEQSIDELRNYHPNRKVFSMYPTNGAGSAVATLFQPPQPPESQPVQAAAATEAKKVATIAELEAACPGADSTFLIAQLKASASITEAQTAFMALLVQENARLKTQPAPAPAAPIAPAPVATMPGNAVVAAVVESADPGWVHDPIAFWNSEIEKRRTSKIAMGTNPHEAQMRAVAETIMAFPGLQDAYNAAMGGVVPRFTPEGSTLG